MYETTGVKYCLTGQPSLTLAPFTSFQLEFVQTRLSIYQYNPNNSLHKKKCIPPWDSLFFQFSLLLSKTEFWTKVEAFELNLEVVLDLSFTCLNKTTAFLKSYL